MTFQAPWGTTLKLISGAATALLIGMSVFLLTMMLDERPSMLLAGLFPILVLLGALPFIVRSYEIDRQGLRIQRLMWTTHVPLDDLQRVWIDPDAMKRSLRLFGNGGLYSFSGIYRNKKLGNYRAFATDPNSSVVLDLCRRKVVVTPDRPGQMVRKLKELWPSIEIVGD